MMVQKCEHKWVVLRARAGYCVIQCVRCGWHTDDREDEVKAGEEWTARKGEWR